MIDDAPQDTTATCSPDTPMLASYLIICKRLTQEGPTQKIRTKSILQLRPPQSPQRLLPQQPPPVHHIKPSPIHLLIPRRLRVLINASYHVVATTRIPLASHI